MHTYPQLNFTDTVVDPCMLSTRFYLYWTFDPSVNPSSYLIYYIFREINYSAHRPAPVNNFDLQHLKLGSQCPSQSYTVDMHALGIENISIVWVLGNLFVSKLIFLLIFWDHLFGTCARLSSARKQSARSVSTTVGSIYACPCNIGQIF